MSQRKCNTSMRCHRTATASVSDRSGIYCQRHSHSTTEPLIQAHFKMPLPPPPMPVYLPPPQNDCCCFCAMPCQFTARTRTHGARIFSAEIAQLEADPSCNNPKLKAIMEENIVDDPSTSKRSIQSAAEKQLSAKFNVICAKGDFSYVAYTESFCQTFVKEVTCYAFQSL